MKKKYEIDLMSLIGLAVFAKVYGNILVCSGFALQKSRLNGGNWSNFESGCQVCRFVGGDGLIHAPSLGQMGSLHVSRLTKWGFAAIIRNLAVVISGMVIRHFLPRRPCHRLLNHCPESTYCVSRLLQLRQKLC